MQVGKTTAADYLVARHGFQKDALADPIKRIATEAFGWDGAKDERGRRLLQEVGTIGRNYGPDLWLDRFAARLAGEAWGRVVVDDVRLAREVDYLERLGFTCVRITRGPELVSAPAGSARHLHETEAELDQVGFTHSIDNSGTFAELFARVDALLAQLDQGRPPAENRKAPSEDGALGD